jgi:hypothetical protein
MITMKSLVTLQIGDIHPKDVKLPWEAALTGEYFSHKHEVTQDPNRLWALRVGPKAKRKA